MAKFRGKEITIGADPEAFGRGVDGSIASMIGRIGGDKHNPLACNSGALQEDNILAEFNIDPATTPARFIKNINTVIGEMHKKISPFKLDFISHAMFSPEFFVEAGPKAMEFGCEPDYNAWTLNVNERPDSNSLMRTAAGHVHIGFAMEDELDPFRAAILMDFYVGLPSVILDPDGAARRSMYGQAGACRPKEYGVEYRVPSNFWLKNEGRMKWMFNSSIKAIKNLNKFTELREKYSEDVPRIINTSDQKGAKQIMKDLGIAV
jgi:hypothetical protein